MDIEQLLEQIVKVLNKINDTLNRLAKGGK